MLEHTQEIVARAEQMAASPEPTPIEVVLPVLRKLSLEEFGELMVSMPNENYPALSRHLPRMAPEHVQNAWTGSAGLTLHQQTAAFVRQFEVAYVRARGEQLQGKTILDFGVGYGRILRELYYYSDPDRLWGVDAWEKSLGHCYEAGIVGNLRHSERVPTELPTGDVRFDAALAFSVFTHLAPTAAEACLDAVRGSMADGGIFVATVRPVEFWAYIDEQRNTDLGKEKAAEHQANGLAYLPHAGPEGESYGDTSLRFEFFDRPGWKMLGYDWSRADPYQVPVILQAV